MYRRNKMANSRRDHIHDRNNSALLLKLRQDNLEKSFLGFTQELEERFTKLETRQEQNYQALQGQLSSFINKQQESKRSIWVTVLGMIGGIVFPILAFSFYFLSVVQENKISPMKEIIAANQSNATQLANITSKLTEDIGVVKTQNQTSIDERRVLSSDIAELKNALGNLTTDQRSFQLEMYAKLTEIETQFRAADEIRNVNLADTRREISMLWEKTFGSKYPNETIYFPRIAQPFPNHK